MRYRKREKSGGGKPLRWSASLCVCLGALRCNGYAQSKSGQWDKLSLNRQKNDWAKVLPVFWSDPQLMNTYWKPAIELLREIETSEEKRDWCKEYSAYAPQADKHGLMQGH